MTIVKFDVSGSDPEKATTDFTPPKPGVYTAKILACTPGHTDNDKTRPRLEVTIVITAKEYKDARVYDYIGLTPASAWKLDQFLQALGLADKKKRKGQFDTAKVLNKTLKVRIKGDNYNDEYRAKIGAYLGVGSDDAPAEDEGEELEETTEEVESEEVEESEGEAEFDEEARTEELNVAELPDLRKIMNEYGLAKTIKGRKPMVAAVIEHERGLFEAEAEEPEEAESEEVEEVEEVEAETADDGYDELTIAELKKECKDRKLSPAGTTAKLIERLRENDAADEEPF